MGNSKYAGKYFEMSDKKSVADIDPIDGITSKDFIVVQLNGGATGLIQLKNLVLGPENVSFYQLIKDVSNTNNTLLDNSLSAVDSYDDLRAYSATEGKLMYVRTEGKEGFFQYRSVLSGDDNGGTILKVSGATGWERINIDRVNIDWFLDRSDNGDINQPKILDAIQYASSKGIDLHIPAGTNIETNPFIISKSISIVGDGPTSTFVPPASANSASFISISADNISIDNINITKAGTITSGLNIANGSNIEVTDCVVSNFSTNIKIDTEVSRYRLVGNDLRLTDNLCIDVVGSTFGLIEGNIITNSSNENPLVNLSASNDLRVVNNFCGNEVEVTVLDTLTAGPIRDVNSVRLIAKNNYPVSLSAGPGNEEFVSLTSPGVESVSITVDGSAQTVEGQLNNIQTTLRFVNGLYSPIE
jgi:hypothetical protein